MSEDEQKDVEQMVEEAIAKLMEHCESVRIFVTTHTGEDSCSSGFSSGLGNFYAQYGQIREWMIRQDERVRVNTREE